MKKKPARKRQRRSPAKFDQSKEVRAIARERVGAVKPSQAITPKSDRKKAKHKKPIDAAEWDNR